MLYLDSQALLLHLFSPFSCLCEATGSAIAHPLPRSLSSSCSQCSVKLSEMHAVKERGTSSLKRKKNPPFKQIMLHFIFQF